MPDAEIERMRQPFRHALLGVAISFVLIGGLIAVYGTGRDRPEGAAERWLTDVGDTTRDGVAKDAAIKVAEHSEPGIAGPLVPAGIDFHGKSAFTSLEVGKAKTVDGNVRVPFEVTLRYHGDGPERYDGTLILERRGDAWHIDAYVLRDPGERVPSDGGPPVAQAPLGLYAGGVLLGVAVTIACSALLRRMGRSARAVAADQLVGG